MKYTVKIITMIDESIKDDGRIQVIMTCPTGTEVDIPLDGLEQVICDFLTDTGRSVDFPRTHYSSARDGSIAYAVIEVNDGYSG